MTSFVESGCVQVSPGSLSNIKSSPALPSLGPWHLLASEETACLCWVSNGTTDVSQLSGEFCWWPRRWECFVTMSFRWFYEAGLETVVNLLIVMLWWKKLFLKTFSTVAKSHNHYGKGENLNCCGCLEEQSQHFLGVLAQRGGAGCCQLALGQGTPRWHWLKWAVAPSLLLSWGHRDRPSPCPLRSTLTLLPSFRLWYSYLSNGTHMYSFRK